MLASRLDSEYWHISRRSRETNPSPGSYCFFSAAEAEKLGLVSKIVDGGRDQVVEAALDIGKVIASKSPVAVFGSKHLLTHSRDDT
jgi:hypothetical protein